ncbi:MAG TPA: hypothetical protein VF808_16665 [Ktedonobacterales bacterium]
MPDFAQSPEAPRFPNRAIRLTFEYEGVTVRLVAQRRLAMVVPRSHAIAGYEGQSGFWFEARDASGRVLYRRIAQNPIRFDVEVFPGTPDGAMRRQSVRNPRGSFDLVIPDLADARTVALVSSPMGPDASLEPAKEFASFDLGGADQRGPDAEVKP